MIAVLAAVVALTGATVLSPGAPPIENATVVIDGRVIKAVGRNVPVPAGARVIDVSGRIITPGLFDPASRLGAMWLTTGEPSAIEGTAGASYDPIRAALRVADTYDPSAIAIPVARAGGITHALVRPTGGVISGQSAVVALRDRAAIRIPEAALHVTLGASGSETGSRTRAFMQLRRALEDARLYGTPGNRGAFIKRKLRELVGSPLDLDVLARAIEGDLRVVFEVDRAPDIRTTLELIRTYRLDAALLGVDEGWMLADQIAAAKVPVIVNPLSDLPESFDNLQARADNARILHEAGVRVAFMTRGVMTLESRLRFAAGNAIAEGFPRDAALAAITKVPAEIFGASALGQIRRGAPATLVVWNGDPFEPLTWAERMYIDGEPVSLRSRQDLLTERYLAR